MDPSEAVVQEKALKFMVRKEQGRERLGVAMTLCCWRGRCRGGGIVVQEWGKV